MTAYSVTFSFFLTVLAVEAGILLVLLGNGWGWALLVLIFFFWPTVVILGPRGGKDDGEPRHTSRADIFFLKALMGAALLLLVAITVVAMIGD